MRWVKASSLVLDYNIYPRHQINDRNVRDIWRAIEAGAEIPPVIAGGIALREKPEDLGGVPDIRVGSGDAARIHAT